VRRQNAHERVSAVRAADGRARAGGFEDPRRGGNPCLVSTDETSLPHEHPARVDGDIAGGVALDAAGDDDGFQVVNPVPAEEVGFEGRAAQLQRLRRAIRAVVVNRAEVRLDPAGYVRRPAPGASTRRGTRVRDGAA